MSFFCGSSHLAISGGNFTINNGLSREEIVNALGQVLGKRNAPSDCEQQPRCMKRRRYSETLLQQKKDKSAVAYAEEPTQRDDSKLSELMIVEKNDVNLRTEILLGNDFRLHSAVYGPYGRVVAVKVFEGPHARQRWSTEVVLSKDLLSASSLPPQHHFITKPVTSHPNLPRIIGVSGKYSQVPFIVFRGISEKKIQPMIAHALRTDLNMSVRLAMKAVKGIAAGLSYIKSQKVFPQSGTNSDLSRMCESFDVFAGDNDEPIITFHPFVMRRDNCSVFTPPNETLVYTGVEVLNGLCQKLFSETNALLYDDSPVRDFGDYDVGGGHHILETGQAVEASSNHFDSIYPSLQNISQSSQRSQPPRREVWWRCRSSPPGQVTSQTLDAISKVFAERLAYLSSTLSTSPLRRVKVSGGSKTLHHCPGYLREEITLMSDLSRSAIITHDHPNESEICSGCGQLICYGTEINNGLSEISDSYEPPCQNEIQSRPLSPRRVGFPFAALDTLLDDIRHESTLRDVEDFSMPPALLIMSEARQLRKDHQPQLHSEWNEHTSERMNPNLNRSPGRPPTTLNRLLDEDHGDVLSHTRFHSGVSLPIRIGASKTSLHKDQTFLAHKSFSSRTTFESKGSHLQCRPIQREWREYTERFTKQQATKQHELRHSNSQSFPSKTSEIPFMRHDALDRHLGNNNQEKFTAENLGLPGGHFHRSNSSLDVDERLRREQATDDSESLFLPALYIYT